VLRAADGLNNRAIQMPWDLARTRSLVASALPKIASTASLMNAIVAHHAKIGTIAIEEIITMTLGPRRRRRRIGARWHGGKHGCVTSSVAANVACLPCNRIVPGDIQISTIAVVGESTRIDRVYWIHEKALVSVSDEKARFTSARPNQPLRDASREVSGRTHDMSAMAPPRAGFAGLIAASDRGKHVKAGASLAMACRAHREEFRKFLDEVERESP
jgi:hypothetical protein